jgi:hypothetical protein
MKKEKQLLIHLLTEKLQKLTGKKVKLRESVKDNPLEGLLSSITTTINRTSPEYLYVDDTHNCVILVLGSYGDSSTWETIEELEEALEGKQGYEFITGRGDDIPNALEISVGADVSLLVPFKDEIDFLLENAESA